MEISKIKITSENPNFKFKNVVKHMDCCFGINDIFDIYYDKNNNFELYLISPSENFSIAITRLKDNQLIKSLQGHNQKITSLRCFYDEIKQKDYLVSSSKKCKVIIWDLSNNFNLLYSLDVDYSQNSIIYSCLLFFSQNKGNYLITCSNETDSKDFTKIYNFENHQLICELEGTNRIEIYYLLSWKNDDKDYLFETSIGRVIVHDLETKNLFHILNSPNRSIQNSACLIKNTQTNKIDLLAVPTIHGDIYFWDLNTFKLKFSIKYQNSYFYDIINWNDKYIIVAEKFNSLIVIIDISIRKIITIMKNKNESFVISLKKINHPLYGESLLSSDIDNNISLYTH